MCEDPIRIKNPKYKDWTHIQLYEYTQNVLGLTLSLPPDYYLDVACGKCFSCERVRMRQWQFRLLHQFEVSENCYFITLTFCDSALEEYKNNYNKAVCQFMDAMRKRFGKEITHFFCLEFGTECGRPHFHGLLFNAPAELDFFVVESIWNRNNRKKSKYRKYNQDFIGFYTNPRGFITLSKVRDKQKCANYITKYITKDMSPSLDVRPRLLTSRGIGSSWLASPDAINLKSDPQLVLSFKGYPFSLPPYLSNKLYSDDDKEVRLIMSAMRPFERYLNGKRYTVETEWRNALYKFHRSQISKKLSRPKSKDGWPRIRKPKKSKLTHIVGSDFANSLFYEYNQS